MFPRYNFLMWEGTTCRVFTFPLLYNVIATGIFARRAIGVRPTGWIKQMEYENEKCVREGCW